MVDIPDTNWRALVGDRWLAVTAALAALVVALPVGFAFVFGGPTPTLVESPRSAGASPPDGTTTVSRAVLDARTPTPVGSAAAAPSDGPRATRSPPQTPILTRSPTTTPQATTATQTATAATATPQVTTATQTATAATATRQATTVTQTTTTPTATRQTTRVSTDGEPGSPTVRVVEIRADAPGADRTTLTREFVVLRNAGSRPLELGNWTVADADGHRYQFPPTATLPANTTVTLHTGVGRDTVRHRYWNRSTPVWNNAGDVIVVRDAGGRERARRAYGTSGG